MLWPILQMWISRCEKPLHHWSDALKSSLAKNWNWVTVKFWSQYLQYLQSYLEHLIHHLAAAVPLLETDNISPVCRYIIEIWPVLIACTWKNRDLLAVFWNKISIFHLGQTEHRSACCDGSPCAQHRALTSIIIILCSTTEWTRETELNWLNYRDFPLHALIFAESVPRAQVAFSSEPSRNLLCATILDIISTCCAYVLLLQPARSPQPHATPDRARAATGPLTFWRHASQRVSLRAIGRSY